MTIAYRLYTVVPRLLELIDNTTNWYIRFNRKRLKGEQTLATTETMTVLDDTTYALNSLFDVLFTVTRLLAPFTPFLTEKIYLLLQPLLPPSATPDVDVRSIHFLAFPTLRPSLFDPAIERRVGRMQKVIELARISRERRKVGLKTPLKSLVVIHPDAVYLDDVRSLEGYITEELNIHELVLTSDEARYDVQYTVSADWPTLGKKLKKQAQVVKKALPSLASEQVHRFVLDGSMTIDGIRLEREDLLVKRGLSSSAEEHLETNTDDDVLTILDARLYPELEREGMAREVVNRVQRLRKKAGLQPTDDVRTEYRVLDDGAACGIEGVLSGDGVGGKLRGGMARYGTEEIDGVMAEEEQEIQKARFMLRLVKL